MAQISDNVVRIGVLTLIERSQQSCRRLWVDQIISIDVPNKFATRSFKCCIARRCNTCIWAVNQSQRPDSSRCGLQQFQARVSRTIVDDNPLNAAGMQGAKHFYGIDQRRQICLGVVDRRQQAERGLFD